MTDLVAQSTLISGTTYNPANQLLTMSGEVVESRTYNSMAQLIFPNRIGQRGFVGEPVLQLSVDAEQWKD